MLADPSFAQDVPQPIGTERVVLDIPGERRKLRRRIGQIRAREALGARRIGLGGAERRHEVHGEAARTLDWPPP